MVGVQFLFSARVMVSPGDEGGLFHSLVVSLQGGLLYTEAGLF